MKFTKEKPKFESGYVWYVETEYPIPLIGFWYGFNNTLYLNTACNEHKLVNDFDRIRFGDEVIKPDTRTNEIEK